jgi:hypothetical protein
MDPIDIREGQEKRIQQSYKTGGDFVFNVGRRAVVVGNARDDVQRSVGE